LGLLSPQTLLSRVSIKQGNLLDLGMKCKKSAFNAQGSRLVILALQVRTIMEVLRKRRDMVKFNSPQKLRSPPPLNVDLNFFLNVFE
jgi:hypothetical protein